MFQVEFQGAPTLCVRPADKSDTLRFFRWRNDPWIVSHGKSKSTVEEAEHVEWFQRALNDPNRFTGVILVDHQPAGGIFFVREDDVATISIYLLKDFVGRGFGTPLIRQCSLKILEIWSNVSAVRAEVLLDNQGSARAFEKAGFTQTGAGEDCLVLHLNRVETPRVIPHNRLTYDFAESAAAADAASSGRWVNGPWQDALENRLGQMAGGSWSATSSGLAALKLALGCLKLEPGDKVIVPAYSCVAVANAVLSLGAEPIAVDISGGGNWNLSPGAVVGAVDDRVRAVIVVNTFGQIAPYESLREVTSAPLIEDGSHGFQIRDGGEKWTIQGDLAITSFYATKLIGCGQGGVVMTRDPDQLESVLDHRSYTDKPPSSLRDNLGLSEMEAAIAYRQFDKFHDLLARRRRLAELYEESLAPLRDAGLLGLPARGQDEVFYRYPIVLSEPSDLEKLRAYLALHHIIAERPVELWSSDPAQDFPNAHQAYETLLSIPLYPSLSLDDARTVATTILNFFQA